MYLDRSFKKIGLLLGITLILSLFVYVTYLGKVFVFGSTPYFYSITVGTRYALDSLAAVIGNSERLIAAASGASLSKNPMTFSNRKASSIPILTYHRIVNDSNDENNVTFSRFEEQMEILQANGWDTVTLQEFEDFNAGKISLPEKSFLLTFDDGAKQSFYPVDPILRKFGFEAAIFIIVESSKTKESTYYMTREEIAWMLRSNRWSIGSHSTDGHRPYGVNQEGGTGIFFADKIWNKLYDRLETTEEYTTRVRADLLNAKKELETTYNVPIRTFAFPLGNESGVLGANNFPEGADITEKVARSVYDIGFLQTNNQRYTFNFPSVPTEEFAPSFASTTDRLRTNFLAYRIHVDHDWNGARLLSLMENGRAKALPYQDDFTTNRGWISAWGGLETGRNNFVITAESGMTSASTFLDGSALWDSYSFDASVNWKSGYAIILADVLDSKTYHACAFSPGEVRIQETIDGHTTTLSQTADSRIQYGDAVQMGIRVHDSVLECTWDFTSLSEVYTRSFSGGIGLQTWDPVMGTASLLVSSVIVRPHATTTP